MFLDLAIDPRRPGHVGDPPRVESHGHGIPKIRSGAELVSVEQLQSSAVQQFIDDMVETMRDANGVGIAAPQVQVSQQIIAIEVSADNPRYPNQSAVPLTVLINPKIIQHVEETENGWEGCLSVPDLLANSRVCCRDIEHFNYPNFCLPIARALRVVTPILFENQKAWGCNGKKMLY